MVQVSFEAKEVTCKVVYYGPGLSGKTTNLQVVHAKAPEGRAGELITINTETDRTLYFDFLPLDLGKVADMRVRLQLYTVPGQVYYNATRKLVLQGVDGVVFVADSLREKREENLESLQNLRENMRAINIDPLEIPLVLQYNKRDLEHPLRIEDLQAELNPQAVYAYVEAIAKDGVGVFQTLKAIATAVVGKLENDYAASMGSRRRSTVVHRQNPPPPPPPPATDQSQPPRAQLRVGSGGYLPHASGEHYESAITGRQDQLPEDGEAPIAVPSDEIVEDSGAHDFEPAEAVVLESMDRAVEHLTGMAESIGTLYEHVGGLAEEIRRLRGLLAERRSD